MYLPLKDGNLGALNGNQFAQIHIQILAETGTIRGPFGRKKEVLPIESNMLAHALRRNINLSMYSSCMSLNSKSKPTILHETYNDLVSSIK